jgi:hypothetical protein
VFPSHDPVDGYPLDEETTIAFETNVNANASGTAITTLNHYVFMIATKNMVITPEGITLG